MAYDAKPTLDDVILSAREDGEHVRVALHLRVCSNELGDLVGEWQGDECRRLLEDGTFRRGLPGGLSGSDEVLAASVLAHATERGLENIVGFEKAILDVMPGAEEVACSIYEEQIEEPPYEGYDAVIGAAGDAITECDFPAVSDTRIHDMHEYLQGVLQDRYEMEATPAP